MAIKTNTSENYILGTDPAELERLGYQHRIWSKEADTAWKEAGFTRGSHLLDLGCGPGFCSVELSQLVGSAGKIYCADKSPVYLNYLEHNQPHLKNIEVILGDFMDIDLPENSLDGIYCRWALAWIENPLEVIQKMIKLLKPGGFWVAHEYLNWGTFKVYPEHPSIVKVIEAARTGWREMEGDINIGRHLPELFEESGLEITQIKPLSKIGKGGDQVWFWPGTFYDIYTLKLIELGLLTAEERVLFQKDWQTVQNSGSGYVVCPSMIEVVGKKVG